MPMTKVYVAVPGTTGHRLEAHLDVSKRVDDMYYRGKGAANMTPVAYCYKIGSKAAVDAAFDQMIREELLMRDRHYKQLLELRRLYGV